MSRKLIAAKPSPCGWFWKSRRNSWRQLTRQRRRSRTQPRANQFHKEAPHKKRDASRRRVFSDLVAGGSGLHVAPGIDRRVVHADFIVNVRAGGAAANAGVPNHLAALDPRSGNGSKSREVRIPRRDSKSVIDHHQAAVAGVVVRDVDNAVGGGVNRRSVIGRHIDSRMERTLSAERVQPLAKAV